SGCGLFSCIPRLVVEVLSKSTRARDRTEKLLLYQAKKTINEIMLISQCIQCDEEITHLVTCRVYQEYGAEEARFLRHLNIPIQIADLYRQLAIPAETRRLLGLSMLFAAPGSRTLRACDFPRACI